MLNEFETTMTEALKPYVNRILTSYADAIRANDGVINDHNGSLEKVSGLIITARMETCPVIQGTAVCTNPVYLKDEIPHWSVVSCAGPYFPWHNNEDLEHAVTRTNRALNKSTPLRERIVLLLRATIRCVHPSSALSKSTEEEDHG